MQDYEMAYNQLMFLKRNPYRLSDKQRLAMLIFVIGDFPDAIQMYTNYLISPEQAQKLNRDGVSGWAIAQNIVSRCSIVGENTRELTYRYYGYVRTITPLFLNQFIDDVATRVQMKREYSRLYRVPNEMDQREDELTLGELEEFSF